MNKKILVTDVSLRGHRFEYNIRILKALVRSKYEVTYLIPSNDNGTLNLLKELGIKVIRIDELRSYKDTINYIFKIRLLVKKNKISNTLILSFDSLVKYGFLFLGIKTNLYCTQHWIFNKRVKFHIVKLLMKFSELNLIVHEKFIKEEFTNNGLYERKINVINYPINTDCEIISREESMAKLNIIQEESFYILAFGGTRRDKGLDLLVRALNNVKYKTTLIIAGKEMDIKQQYIEEIFNPKNKNSKIIYHMNFIANEDLKFYFSMVDTVAVPYTKEFLGQSGPLTEAIKYEKPVIGPKWQVIEQIINDYNCGVLFEVEDIDDLSKSIELLIENFDSYKKNVLKNKTRFIENRTCDVFVNSYLKIIDKNF